MAEETATGDVVESPTGTPSFSATVENPDPFKSTVLDPPKAPEGVPEKFWDAEKGEVRVADMAKSYAELEAKLSAPKGPDPDPDPKPDPDPDPDPKDPDEGDPKDPDEGDPKDPPEAADLSAAMESAQKVFAETGELSAEARAPFLKAGISDEQINLYIQGVKAFEQGLQSAAVKAAGVEDYAQVQEAVAWAAENWTPKQIEAFNSQTGDLETISGAVKTLFADYRDANPGEGRLTNVNSGANRGDVYGSRAEFDQALAKADRERDPVARKSAIEKLNRSLKAKSLK